MVQSSFGGMFPLITSLSPGAPFYTGSSTAGRIAWYIYNERND